MSSSSASDGSGGAERLAAQAISALPPEYRDMLLKPGRTPDRIQHAINWAAKKDPAVLAQHQELRHNVKRFEDIHNLPLEQLDTVAQYFARKYRRRALLTGAITGLPGGLWALIAASADVQLTAVYAVRMATDIAQSYGYNTALPEEQAHLAEVLALAAGIDSMRGISNWLTREGLVHMLPELLPKILMRLSVEITEEQAAKWIGRIIPGFGAAIGGTIDYTFLRVAGEHAIKYYHQRVAEERGLVPSAPRIVASAPTPRLPAPGGAVVPATPARPAAPPAKVAQPAAPAAPKRKERKSAPERFGIYLAIFAVFALGITILACYAIAALAVLGVHHLLH
jgi:hypothetical protein